ncbi:hypothetical protein [Aestuariibacter salexigens]|uniref:hypothetical protein n=1 Tax=Aestuariibacter salexigens TaxID=226010 RepID=UPI000403DDEC|nr:hypothetical protein [Aestuariibacter salexigens]
MHTTITYRFPDAVLANRFKNTLTHWSVADVKAKLSRDDKTVSVAYQIESRGYDRTAAELDDLADSLQGREID